MSSIFFRLSAWPRWMIGVVASADPLVLLPVQIYGPFLAVGAYMMAVDDCVHCQKAFFEYLLILPGVVVSAVITRLTSRSFAPNVEPVHGAIALVITFAVVIGLSRALPGSARHAFGWCVVVPVFFLEALLCRALMAM